MRTESEIEPVCQVSSYGKSLPGPGNHNKENRQWEAALL